MVRNSIMLISDSSGLSAATAEGRDGFSPSSICAGAAVKALLFLAAAASESFSLEVELVFVASGLTIMAGRILMMSGFRVGTQAHVMPMFTSTALQRKAKEAFHANSGCPPNLELGSADLSVGTELIACWR
jgi:hypothetical protein